MSDSHDALGVPKFNIEIFGFNQKCTPATKSAVISSHPVMTD